ncbi:MAG: hypothetical protein JXB04_09025 [Kiritimatiellae bacterium]|nr:hypothetical protein [Kiritimatiellia bacterium]
MKAFMRVTVLLCILALAAHAADYRHLSTVHDGSGTMSTGGSYTNWSAAGQPGGIFTSSSGDLVNHAGFLQAVDIKKPGLDTDGDGTPDELDLDNDGDRLTDVAEIGGSTFTPTTPTLVNVPDTDSDDVPDGDEAAAGTDPTDEAMYLHILSIDQNPSGREITWLARSGKEYHVLADDNSHSYPTDILATNQEFGGTGDWEVRTNTYTDVDEVHARFFGIEPVQ